MSSKGRGGGDLRVLMQERWEEPDMEFHHVQNSGSMNGSHPEQHILTKDDLEIDAAQGGSDKVDCHLLSSAHFMTCAWIGGSKSMMQLSSHSYDLSAVCQGGVETFGIIEDEVLGALSACMLYRWSLKACRLIR